jgi:hypothetical protein
MQDALAALEQNYMNIQAQVGTLSLNCDPAQKQQLISQLVAARSAYWNCVNKAFHDDDPQVIELTNQLKASNDELQKDTKELGGIASVLDKIDTAVTIATKLAGFVIPG